MLFPYLILALASLSSAKTNLSGCTSSEVIAYGGASLLWYVPGTGEICSFLDCGGGTAPPMTTVPGCPLYSGTSTYSPSFLSGFNGALIAASSTSYVAAAASSTPSPAMVTGPTTMDAFGSDTTLSEVTSSSSIMSDSVLTDFPASTGVASGSQSTSSITESLSGTGTASGSSTSSAASSSSSPNAGTSTSASIPIFGIMGAVGAAAALLT